VAWQATGTWAWQSRRIPGEQPGTREGAVLPSRARLENGTAAVPRLRKEQRNAQEEEKE